METNKPAPNLELKLSSLKDQFLANLRATKLVVNPRIEGSTLHYEKRRGSGDACRALQAGVKVLLNREYCGNVDIRFHLDGEKYSIALEVLAENTKAEQELIYDALTKINKFISFYVENQRRKR